MRKKIFMGTKLTVVMGDFDLDDGKSIDVVNKMDRYIWYDDQLMGNPDDELGITTLLKRIVSGEVDLPTVIFTNSLFVLQTLNRMLCQLYLEGNYIFHEEGALTAYYFGKDEVISCFNPKFSYDIDIFRHEYMYYQLTEDCYKVKVKAEEKRERLLYDQG